MAEYNAIKVFSATKAKEREELGEVITHWLEANSGIEIVDTVIRQSSDSEYHCLTIVILYKK